MKFLLSAAYAKFVRHGTSLLCDATISGTSAKRVIQELEEATNHFYRNAADNRERLDDEERRVRQRLDDDEGVEEV